MNYTTVLSYAQLQNRTTYGTADAQNSTEPLARYMCTHIAQHSLMSTVQLGRTESDTVLQARFTLLPGTSSARYSYASGGLELEAVYRYSLIFYRTVLRF